jgi:hypothetical protein
MELERTRVGTYNGANGHDASTDKILEV